MAWRPRACGGRTALARVGSSIECRGSRREKPDLPVDGRECRSHRRGALLRRTVRGESWPARPGRARFRGSEEPKLRVDASANPLVEYRTSRAASAVRGVRLVEPRAESRLPTARTRSAHRTGAGSAGARRLARGPGCGGPERTFFRPLVSSSSPKIDPTAWRLRARLWPGPYRDQRAISQSTNRHRAEVPAWPTSFTSWVRERSASR